MGRFDETTMEQAVKHLDDVQAGDKEHAHAEADRIVMTYLRLSGQAAVANAWARVEERAKGFWYA